MGDGRDECEKLFLLEVLVDSLFISNSSLNLDKNLASNLTDTCVMFQFLHYPPMVVCESDFIGAPVGHSDNSHITFKGGKSCFFSLRVPRGPILPVPFEVKVNVIRKLKEGMLPDKLEIGKTSIDMSESFTQLLQQNVDENCDMEPMSKVNKGIFEIKDDSSKTVGSLTAFLRLSCFGKLIITQFSLSKEDEKAYLFKGMDINKIRQQGDNKNQPVFSKQPTGEPRPVQAAGIPPQKGYSIDQQKQTGMGQGYRVKEYEPIPSGYGPNSSVAPYGAIPYGGGKPCICPPPQDHAYSPPPQFSRPINERGAGGLCNCPYPVPPSVMSKYTQRTARSSKNMELAPGEVGLQDDQVVFQLPLKKPGEQLTDRDKEIDSSVFYKLTSAEATKEGVQKNTVQVRSDELPGMATNKMAIGPVSGLPVDENHDVFLLKIGKKCEGDKKRNLELELRTPRMKEPKPPMTDQFTQYMESDIPRESKDKGKKGKSKDKGKKGKGKKKSK